MEVEPVAVGRASRSWDEQHLDLVAASRQIGRAVTAGFTPAVADVASRFTDAWAALVADLGSDCGAWAEALRLAAGDCLATDGVVRHDFLTLGRRLAPPR
jgi:hypothetical protein